jgi:hypothetical protein
MSQGNLENSLLVNESLGLTDYCSKSPGRMTSPDFPGESRAQDPQK